ncbi:MAG TPA: hypothetical protein VFJ85_18580 [Acidimicrobiales bacterium]|nr:hypothetical protein [Acidimicrobiales bacterium]
MTAIRVDRRAMGRWGLALAGAGAAFGLLVLTKGANPLSVYSSMWSSVRGSSAVDGILLKATPLVLAALAVAVPARAGLVNVGGEGQLVMGGVFAMGTSLLCAGRVQGAAVLVLMCVAAAVGGALWSGIAALLRLLVGINEAVTTLLLNYLAINIMSFLIFDRWKDRQGSGQPVTRPLAVAERFPLLGSRKVHAGLLLAVAATAAVWWVLRSTRWGFQLRVVGGNPEAARRAGLRVALLTLSAMLVGGALAGLGGAAQLAGAEFKLRQGFLLTYGYVGFLASWLARHKPVNVALAAVALAAISVAGDSLQLDSGLPAATVNVLMALVLLAVFGWTRMRKAAAA